MKNIKHAPQTEKDCELIAQEIRRTLNPLDEVSQWEMQILDSIFSESRKDPEQFHHTYVTPLMDEGVPVESAYQLLVEGVFRPN